MFNQYLELTPENADIIIANTVIENLKFIVIALDLVFQKKTNSDFYDEDYTFYFYHLQNAFTSCGNIINVFSNNLRRSQLHNERAKHLKETFNINLNEYPHLFNKKFRNANEHFDERYDLFNMLVGDYNVIGKNTPAKEKHEIQTQPHIRTLDLQNWMYITYDKKGEHIYCDLRKLRDEAYLLLYKISTHPRVVSTKLTHIPTKEIVYT